MTKTLTGKFSSLDAAKNAHADFIDTGFPTDMVFLDSEGPALKVIASSDNESEIREILDRHKPSGIEVHGKV